jgi:beta-glucosidase
MPRCFQIVLHLSLAAVAFLLLVPGAARAAEIRTDLTGGQFYTKGARTEVYGRTLEVVFSGLPAGTYTVEVDAAELFFNQPGRRAMNIACGETVLAKNWDPFKEAGGAGKTATVRAKVDHPGDSLRGPLVVAFTAVADNAKFDEIRVLDAAGAVVARTTAAALQAQGDRFGSDVPQVSGPEVWKDPAQSPSVRAADLVRRLSLREKVSQLQMAAPAIPRLGIPAYDWWNECLHGVARAGRATVFPQAIAAAATFDDALWQQAATAMSDEARAKHHEYARTHGGASARYFGLDMWSPNVNIFRDPRWGRGQETYGEDPYLTGRFGVAFVRGLQGDDPRYLKVIATPKHFAIHSGPENLRHVFDVDVSNQDLWETYLPAFEACFREGRAYSVMGAYNRFRGDSCSAHPLLLEQILRRTWGFAGYSVSDVDSVGDIYQTHKLRPNAAGAAALALTNGLDLNSGTTYQALLPALRQRLVAVEDIDRALLRCLEARIRLGMFDPPEQVPYARIPISVNACPAHDQLALQVARASLVLLKNDQRTLPLAKAGTVAVIGPNADDAGTRENDLMVGNYSGTPPSVTTVLAGIRQKLASQGRVLYAKGCEISRGSPAQAEEALGVARQADAVIMVLGINAHIEGEEGAGGGDRTQLGLFPHQQVLLERVAALGKPVVLVLMNGSALAVNWAHGHIPAILEAWYPGQRGGEAVADVLFGDYNPAGRLPVTFYRSEQDLPDFKDYAMKGRTYRYFRGQPLYAFGHGLSYTTFKYDALRQEAGADEQRLISVKVTNTGTRAGDEVVQLYVSRREQSENSTLPIRSLRGFKRVHVEPGETKTVTFTLAPFQFAFADQDGVRTVEAGEYLVGVGGSQQPAQTVVINFPARLVNPPYAHSAPQVQ